MIDFRPKEEEKSHVSGYVSYTNVGTNVEGRKAPTLVRKVSGINFEEGEHGTIARKTHVKSHVSYTNVNSNVGTKGTKQR